MPGRIDLGLLFGQPLLVRGDVFGTTVEAGLQAGDTPGEFRDGLEPGQAGSQGSDDAVVGACDLAIDLVGVAKGRLDLAESSLHGLRVPRGGAGRNEELAQGTARHEHGHGHEHGRRRGPRPAGTAGRWRRWPGDRRFRLPGRPGDHGQIVRWAWGRCGLRWLDRQGGHPARRAGGGGGHASRPHATPPVHRAGSIGDRQCRFRQPVVFAYLAQQRRARRQGVERAGQHVAQQGVGLATEALRRGEGVGCQEDGFRHLVADHQPVEQGCEAYPRVVAGRGQAARLHRPAQGPGAVHGHLRPGHPRSALRRHAQRVDQDLRLHAWLACGLSQRLLDLAVGQRRAVLPDHPHVDVVDAQREAGDASGLEEIGCPGHRCQQRHRLLDRQGPAPPLQEVKQRGPPGRQARDHEIVAEAPRLQRRGHRRRRARPAKPFHRLPDLRLDFRPGRLLGVHEQQLEFPPVGHSPCGEAVTHRAGDPSAVVHLVAVLKLFLCRSLRGRHRCRPRRQIALHRQQRRLDLAHAGGPQRRVLLHHRSQQAAEARMQQGGQEGFVRFLAQMPALDLRQVA